MKFNLKRGALLSFHAIAVVLAVAIFGPIGSALALVNTNTFAGILGASYPVINATTAAELATATPKVREELWVRRVLAGGAALYQDNPFADNMVGRFNLAKPDASKLKKAVVQMSDATKVKGNTINIPTMAGFGGPGVFGAGNRIGAEQKVKAGNLSFQIGVGWWGVGYQATARDETVIGGSLDEAISTGLRTLISQKQGNDHMMRLRQASETAIGARNILLPSGVGSFAELLSADVVKTTLISRGGEILPGLGALPMDTTNDSGGSLGELYTFMSTDRALVDLHSEPAYLSAQQYAGTRGEDNAIFKGGLTKWHGHGIYRWINRDHANLGPVGSPLLPRAFLGAVSASGVFDSDNSMTVASGTIIYGGGNVWEAFTNAGEAGYGSPLPNYFEFFKNAPYTFWNGQTIAADTSTTRHLMIVNPNGTFGVFPYAVNTGNAITINGSALAVGPSGKRVTAFVKGAQIVQCNVLGTPYAYSLFLGAQALVCGNGSINGSAVDPQMGVRTEEIRNHGQDIGIGVQGVWGNAAVTRAGDNAYPNFLVATHAVTVENAPSIT